MSQSQFEDFLATLKGKDNIRNKDFFFEMHMTSKLFNNNRLRYTAPVIEFLKNNE